MSQVAVKEDREEQDGNEAFPCPRVSARDQLIYRLCKVEGKTQKKVADQFKLTQARVSQIIKRVAEWMGNVVPPGLDELPREKRLRCAARTHKMRLDFCCGEAMGAWEKSNEADTKVVRKYDKTGQMKEETQASKARPNTRHLLAAVKLSEMLVKFEGFDEYGRVDEGLEGRQHESPDVDIIKGRQLTKQWVFEGRFDTEGDVGIPDSILARLGARFRLDGTPFVAAQQSLSKYSPTYDQSAGSYWTRNITAQDPLSRNPGLSAEQVQGPVVTTELEKKKGLYSNPEVISGSLGDKSAQVVEEVMQKSAAVQTLTPALSTRSCADDREYRGEGVKKDVVSPPPKPAAAVKEKRPVFWMKMVDVPVPQEPFPELHWLAREALRTLREHGIYLKPRPAEYVDPPPEPERLMPDGLPWARSEEEARARGYCQWTTDPTPEERAAIDRRRLPKACRDAYDRLEVLDVEVVPTTPTGWMYGK